MKQIARGKPKAARKIFGQAYISLHFLDLIFFGYGDSSRYPCKLKFE